MHDLSTPEVVASILTTWAIGLLPPVLIRYVLLKRPMTKWPAVGTCAFFWLSNMFLFIALGSKSKSHAALVMVAFVSYWILRRGTAASRQIGAAEIGKNGFTELMYAAAEGHTGRITTLLATGSSVNAANDQGKTCLMYAAMNGHREVVQLLLQHGADPDLTTKVGRSAAWFAKRRGFDDVLRTLGEHKSARDAHGKAGAGEQSAVTADLPSASSDLNAVMEVTSLYMALQVQLASGKVGVAERARSMYGLGFLLGIVDGVCQHHMLVQESEDGIRIAAAVFQAVFQNSITAEEQLAASVAAQDQAEHRAGMVAGGEEILRFLSGDTLGILGLGAFLATGRKRGAGATA